MATRRRRLRAAKQGRDRVVRRCGVLRAEQGRCRRRGDPGNVRAVHVVGLADAVTTAPVPVAARSGCAAAREGRARDELVLQLRVVEIHPGVHHGDRRAGTRGGVPGVLRVDLVETPLLVREGVGGGGGRRCWGR